MAVILNSAYFPPIAYIATVIAEKDIIIEAWENYSKQTYRNRCMIASANGILPLVVPIKKKSHPKTPIQEIAIDYSDNWTKIQLKAIESAYRSSPFYEFYIHDFIDFFSKRYSSLFELNLEILKRILEVLDWKVNLQLSSTYNTTYDNMLDFREVFHPKKDSIIVNKHFKFDEYYQVFKSKTGFEANLSILDLLFHLGPESESYLTRCFQHHKVNK